MNPLRSPIGVLLSLAIAAVPALAQAQIIRLEDIIAGGDGSGNAPAENLGVNPDTGDFVTTLLQADVVDSDGINPSPVPGSPFIDSVFLLGPSVTLGELALPLIQPITQSQVTVVLPHDDGMFSGFNSIAKNRVGGLSEPGIAVGAVDTFTTSIGIHASAGVTLDLDALRATHGAEAVGCFSAFWGLGACQAGLANLHAVLSTDAGVLFQVSRLFAGNEGDWIQFAIPPEARYLTLACGSAGPKACDWGTLARPIIAPAECPMQSFSWIWEVVPNRVRAFEPSSITLHGEGFQDDQIVRVGGVDATATRIASPNELTADLPELPPGADDVEVVVAATGEVMAVIRLGLVAVESPTVSSVTPGDLFAAQPTFVAITGTGFTSTTSIHFESTGPQGSPQALLSPVLVSSEQIQGFAPALDPDASPGEKTLLVDDGVSASEFPGLVRYIAVGIQRVEPGVISTLGGTEVSFIGSGFTPDLAAKLGGLALESQQFVSEGEIRGISPVLPAGPQDASLENGAGEIVHALPGAVQATLPGALSITSVNPAEVSALGGSIVTVTTSSFHLNGKPRIGGKILTNAVPDDAMTLRGESPTLEPGLHDVEIVDAIGEVLAVLESGIRAAPPADVTISAISPNEVSTLGGTKVTITGTGFTNDVIARVGGNSLDQLEIVDEAHIRGITLPLEEGLHDVSVETSEVLRGSMADAVFASAPQLPARFRFERVGPSRFSAAGGSRIRFVGAEFPADAVPRIGGVPLEGVERPSPCRVVGNAPALQPGLYHADLFRPGFGVVAELDDLVEVAPAGAPPRISHIGSADVLTDGTTRLYIFGHDFQPTSLFLVGERPITDPTFVSDELVVGNAPALDAGEIASIRDMVVSDERGATVLRDAVEYVEPSSTGVPFFQRGDANQSGRVDLSDAITTLGFLFLGSPTSLDCEASADMDSSGVINISDAIFLLQYLFLGGPGPNEPFDSCGADPQPLLSCERFGPCSPGGGAGIGGAVVQENVVFLAESPVDPADPVLVDVDAESGEAVIADPPGGKDLKVGEIINGLVPLRSESIHKGLAYMLKIGEETTGRCVAAGEGEKVFKVRSATLPEVFRELDTEQLQVSFAGARTSSALESRVSVHSCAPPLGGGGAFAGPTSDGGGGDDSFVDFELRDNPLLQWDFFHAGDNYIKGGFRYLKLRYNAPTGLQFGIGIKQEGLSAPEITRLTAFMGPLLDVEFDGYLKAHFEDKRKLEKKVYETHKPKLFFIYGLAIFVDASTEVNLGVEIDASLTLEAEMGARAGYKFGAGVQLDGSGFHDISGYEVPHVDALPDRPNASADGRLSVRPFLRPKAKLFVGLEVDLLSGSLEFDNEAYITLHGEASTKPVPCLHYGIDAGVNSSLRAKFSALELFDIYDHTWSLLGFFEPNLIEGQLGCLRPPVAVLKVTGSGPFGSIYTLDASGSRDPDGGQLNFRWDLDGDGQCDLNTGHTPRTTLELGGCPTIGGCFRTVKVMVTDDEKEKAEATARISYR